MNERWSYAWVGVLGLLCGLILSGYLPAVSAAQSNPETLTVRKLTIVGKDGKPRATIGVEDDGAVDMVLYDGNGVRRIGLGTGGPSGKGKKNRGGGAALNLFDEDGKIVRNRVYVRDSDGSTGLTLSDKYGQPRAGLSISAVGSPASP